MPMQIAMSADLAVDEKFQAIRLPSAAHADFKLHHYRILGAKEG
jgi:hypothetical protein